MLSHTCSGWWLRSQFSSLSLGWKLLSFCPAHAWFKGSARDELRLYAEFRTSDFSLLAPPYSWQPWLSWTLSPVYSTRKMIFLLNFYCIYAATIVLLSSKAANRNKQMNHREAILCLSLAPGFISPLKLACPCKIFKDLGSVFVFIQSL